MIKLFTWFWNVDPKWKVITILGINKALLENKCNSRIRKESTFRFGIIEE